jgi:RNA methyltransferase, TrmH family
VRELGTFGQMQPLSLAKLKEFAALGHRKDRLVQGRYIAEGRKLVAAALAAGAEVEAVVVSKIHADEAQALTSTSKCELYFAADAQLRRLSDQPAPEGMVAIIRLPSTAPSEELDPATNPALWLAGLQDPGNVGTLLRTASWYGIRQVVCRPGTVDVFSSKVVRAAMGASFSQFFSYPEDFDARVGHSPSQLLAASVLPGSLPLGSGTFRGIEGLILGSESHGLPSEIEALAGLQRVFLPSYGATAVESLNVGVAGGILLAAWAQARREAA